MTDNPGEPYRPTHAAQPAYDESLYSLGDPETDEEGFEDDGELQDEGAGGRRRGEGRRGGCLPVLIGLVLVAGLLAFGIWKGLAFVKDKLADPADYAGPGHGKVLFEVHQGDTATEIGRNLKAAGVVESVDAFISAASAEPRSSGIQVGLYQLKKQMPAVDALKVLIDHDNLVQNLVTVPEGLRVADIVDLLVKKTGVPKADFDKWLAKADKLGLPDYANGNPEGYLFPATYDVGPKPTAKKILTAMIQRWQEAADDVDLEGAADRLGYTPGELMTVASLVEAEARGDDMPKVARVIYNRIENPGTAGTVGYLEIDATVNYALGRNLGVALTEEETHVDSPYNTYENVGLPPGPIEAPGEDAMRAAIEPASGDWYYYVTVNLKTGETKFAESYDEFLRYKAEFKQYCETSEAC